MGYDGGLSHLLDAKIFCLFHILNVNIWMIAKVRNLSDCLFFSLFQLSFFAQISDVKISVDRGVDASR